MNSLVNRGVAPGVDIGIYTPKKSAQVNFLRGKKWRQNGYSTVLYPQKKFIPQTNFWLRPCLSMMGEGPNKENRPTVRPKCGFRMQIIG